MQRLFTNLYAFLSSGLFFRLIVASLVVSASWLALSGQYPMAFDEDFHYGLIKVYSSHIFPILSSQPLNADAYGAVARDPSFLFHYLMSFPYRLISLFTNNQTVIVIILRALDIAMFASALPIFKRLLKKAGASDIIVNGSLALFVLIPITPMLAAQINYDNMLLPVVALFLLLSLSVPSRPLPEHPKIFLQLVALGLFGSLIKFAFLPIFLAVGLWLIIVFKPVWRQRQMWWNSLKPLFKSATGIGLSILIVLLGVLAVDRYGINLIRYHDPIPDCGKVLTLNHCQNYGPYIRDYNFSAAKTTTTNNPISFTNQWLYGMWFRSVFTVDGPKTQFQTRGPLLVPAIAEIILLIAAAAAFLFKGLKIWRMHPQSTSLFVLVSLVYLAALWLQEFKAYVHTAMPVAINSRYLLPIILLIMCLAIMAASAGLGRFRNFKIAFLAIGLLAFMYGGGGLTYVLRSNDSWYWNNASVRNVNHAVQNTIGPLVPGYYNPILFLR